MKRKRAALDPTTLEARVVRHPKQRRQYYVRVGMLGELKGQLDVFVAEIWIGRHKDAMRPKAYTIRGIPPQDAHKIRMGADLFERIYLILDAWGRPSGLQWKETTKLKKEEDKK